MPMNIKQILEAVTPAMALRAILYPWRAAPHVARATHPQRRGLAYWRAVFSALRTSSRTEPPPLHASLPLGAIEKIALDEGRGITATGTGGAMRIAPLADDLLLIRAQPDNAFPAPFSYSVVKAEDDWPPVEATIANREDSVEIVTPALILRLSKREGHFTLCDGEGRILLAGGEYRRYVDGAIAWWATCAPQTAFYGLGEKASAINHAGRRFELWNTDPVGYDRGDDPLYLSIPFVIALHEGSAVGLFFDNSYRAWLDLGATKPGVIEYRALGGEFRLYLMVGTPQRILERYTELTGRPSLPPLWALGFHQSRWSYFPQERVLEIAREFRQRRLPCDVIHLDIHHMDGCRCFTWHPEHFPDPRGMIAALHQQGFKVMVIVDPGIKAEHGYWVYEQGVAQDRFIKYPDGTRYTAPVWPGFCHFPDFSDAEVREWWGELHRGLLEDGVDALWNDMNEIALIVRDTRHTWVPDVVRHSKEGLGADHAEIHNVYGLLMARASYEGLRRLRPERRPLVLSRSGWAGLQRYAIHWTGDNRSTWDHLRLSVQMVLTLGLSGIAISGPDVGGFGGGPTPELYARWMQVGAFMPFFRVHCMINAPQQEPWAFGPQVETISRQYLELRYRLLPYLYTAVWQAARYGLPIARAMPFVYPHDVATYSMDDQYLFGDALLVAPVMDEGVARRTVYLPPGVWYDFWTGQMHQGGQTLNVHAPLEMLPLFVRGGAVISLWPVQQYVGEKNLEELELRVYPAAGEHHSLLYEDNGEGNDYEAPHAHRLSRLTVHGEPDGGSFSLIRTIEEGTYTPPYARTRLIVIGLRKVPTAITLRGGNLLHQEWDTERGRLILLTDAEGTFDLHVS